MLEHDRYYQAKKVTLVGGVINTLLGMMKLMGGFLFHSHALVADGIHSFSDLLTDMMVLFASKYGSQDADEAHPYGHQRIETAATLMLALLLILAGAGIVWDSLYECVKGTHDKPGFLALPIAVFSMLANEALFHATRRVGLRIQSDLILANAWHHRSDAAASLIVLVGLVGALLGFLYLDALAAVVVGLLVIKMGWTYGWNSVKELVDTAVEPAMYQKIEAIIQGIGGVQRIHQLRTRMMGQDVFIDVHILVNPYISVSEGHYIAQHVHRSLLMALDSVKDVTVHIDPEDDELECPSFHLPTRLVLEQDLIYPLQQQFPAIQTWLFHYLEGSVVIDLVSEPSFDQGMALNNYLALHVPHYPDIKKVRLFTMQSEYVHFNKGS